MKIHPLKHYLEHFFYERSFLNETVVFTDNFYPSLRRFILNSTPRTQLHNNRLDLKRRWKYLDCLT